MPARFLSSLSEVRTSPDLLIIGGGIVGLATAFACLSEGLRPLLFERLPTPAALTSRRSGEGVRAQWELPHNIEIALASIAFYRDFGERLGDDRLSAGYRPLGYLYASRTSGGAAVLKQRVERQHKEGLEDVVYLDGPAARSQFPLLAEQVEGAVFRAGDGVVDVDSIVRGYLERMDADIILDVEALDILPAQRGVSVQTNAGRLDAGAVVLANGARLGTTLRRLGYDVGLRPARSSILYVNVPGIPSEHPATIDTDIGSFWRPDASGARITASFRGTLFVNEGIDDPPPDPDYLAHALRTVSPLVPLWSHLSRSIGDTHLRTGTFTVTPDGSPLIGPLAAVPGVFVNGGYGGHGVMMSPDGARRLAAMLASGREPERNPFSASRFSRGATPAPEPMTIHLHEEAKEDA